MMYLLAFNRVYRLEIQSVLLLPIFDPFSLVHILPSPLPWVNKYRGMHSIHTVFNRWGGGGGGVGGPTPDKNRPPLTLNGKF